MTVLVKNIIEFLIYPMNIFWILIALYFFLRWKKHPKSERLLYLGLLFFFISGTKWLPDLMVYGLEKQYNTFDPVTLSQNDTFDILVLGAGMHYDIELTATDRLSQASLSRLIEGVRIYNQLESSRLILSGYHKSSNTSNAFTYMMAAADLGVNPEHMFLQEDPTTTEEEAKHYYKNYSKKDRLLILVTSDIHMPRAMKWFKKQGIEAIAAPTGSILKRNYSGVHESIAKKFEAQTNFNVKEIWWKSHHNNFDKFRSAMHEYIGMVYARLF
jgi:uncharacterized SAM-binding protein YcdF (DUF218 family)